MYLDHKQRIRCREGIKPGITRIYTNIFRKRLRPEPLASDDFLDRHRWGFSHACPPPRQEYT